MKKPHCNIWNMEQASAVLSKIRYRTDIYRNSSPGNIFKMKDMEAVEKIALINATEFS